jgi:hypothetical protein
VSVDREDHSLLRLVEPDRRVAIPEGVEIAEGVDLDRVDPAVIDGRRVCIARRRAGGRCRAAPPLGALFCNAHSGTLNPRLGGVARAAKRRQRADAERASRLGGIREVVARTLAERQDEVAAAVALLLAGAADADAPHTERIAAARALLPWIQALATPAERVEPRLPATVAELAEMSDEALHELLAARLTASSKPPTPQASYTKPAPSSLPVSASVG